MTVTLHLDPDADLARLSLPAAVAARLQTLLDRQDAGFGLTDAERLEAEGLADLVDFFSLLLLRAMRTA